MELIGFKSFADKTVLDFADGACGVVGPNGSGKSNISDAIRWAIGETSAKSLRGANMQDIIFAGTESRKGKNYAEVSLILDNSSHEFAIDYEEVKVTRQLFKSGESIYKINDAACRLKDIHEMFMDTGLGRDGYSIIGQGNVSKILSTKAEDRRSIFEEAAGVSKYKYKKEEAIRKLTRVEENLVRINDISSELESRLAPLEKQSEKARKYLSIYGEMRQLDINLSVAALDENREAMKAANELYESVETELEALHKQETENDRVLSGLYEESRRSDEEKTEVNARLVENESRISAARNDVVVLKNNISNNDRRITELETLIEAAREGNKNRVELIRTETESIENKSGDIKKLSDELEKAKELYDELTEKVAKTDEEIANKRQEYFANQSEISKERERISGIDALRRTYIERREAVETEIKAFEEGMLSTGRQLEETEKGISDAQIKLDELTGTVNTLNRSKTDTEEKLAAINTELAETEIQRDTKESKRNMLRALENDYAGYSKSVKAVLTSDELKKYALYGTVAGLTQTDKKYAVAIETALGASLQNIITESEEDAKQAIAFLRRTGGGRATFLPITSVKGRELDNINKISKAEGFVGVAYELITYDKRYDGIFRSLLGRVVVMDNIDNAISLSRLYGYKFKVVTLSGEVLNAGGSISGGSTNTKSGFLSRAAEIKTLTSDIAELSRNIKRLGEERSAAEGDLSLIDGQLGSFTPLIREYEDEIIRLENTRRMLNEAIDASNRSGYEQELSELSENISKTGDETARLIAHISSVQTKNDAIEAETNELLEKRDGLVQQQAELYAANDAAALDIAAINTEIAVSENTVAAAKEGINTSEQEISDRYGEIEEIKASNELLKGQISEKQALSDDAVKLSEEIRKRLEAIDAKKADITDRMEQFRTDGRDITDKIINLQKELSRADGRRIKLDNEYDGIINRLWDDYELGYESACEQKTDIGDIKTDTARLDELKKKIKAIGNVNMDAIEEYKEIRDRFEFMTTQKADLEKSKKNLTSIISSMEELMREHFVDQFGEINKAFGEVFRELFGGGRAKLYLSEPDDILASGIEIEIQLPGKGMQNLNLYSGGEKSFIAIALLFAILRVKPTPFCILDEIDAALDDVNVSRFATYLKNYTERTQFIVITHRRGTMEAASILYGVTMQESGVSKLLSLTIDDVEDEMIE